MSAPATSAIERRSSRARARVWAPLLVVAACNLPGLRNVSNAPLVGDFDTPKILEAIREDTSAAGLLRWFARDWPLGNGFYRPVVAISIACDSAVYGDYARGYRLTSWLLALVCSLAAYWLLASLSGSRAFGCCAAAMFALRQSGGLPEFPAIVRTLWAAAILMGLVAVCVLHRGESEANRRIWPVLVTAGAAFALVMLEWRSNAIVVQWIAARTALLGALFSVVALGCFVRIVLTGRRAWIWPTLVAACLALCSYEQSVMLPFAAAATLLWRRPRDDGWAPRIALALLGVALVAYVAVRLAAVGDELRPYYLIQAKTSIVGPVWTLADYTLPPLPYLRNNWLRMVTAGPTVVIDQAFWVNSALIVGWILAFVRLCRMAWRPTLALWLVKALTYLPMAFLHFFPHYLYLPEVAACALGIAVLWPGGLRAPGAPERGARLLLEPRMASSPCSRRRRASPAVVDGEE